MKLIEYHKESNYLIINWKWKGKNHSKYLQCPFATWWKARKYFKRPRFQFFCGRQAFYPFASTNYIKRSTVKWFPIYIGSQDIGWKDKWNEPRFETNGYFMICFGRNYETAWQIGFIVKAPKTFIYDCNRLDIEDNYWESILWYLYYNEKYKSKTGRNLIKARNSFNNHWITTKDTTIKKAKILSTKLENVLNFEFFVVSLKCKYLINKLYYNYLLTDKVSVFIKARKDDKCIIVSSTYVHNNDDKTIDIYVRNFNIDEFINILDSADIEVELQEEIDLGPTFKDQFLNNKGIKLIQNEGNKIK